jgi:hypothetical protein
MKEIMGYPSYTLDEMKKMSTRQLLGHLRKTYCWGDSYSTWEEIHELDKYQKQIKSVLATREHIPNKQESKAIRKAKIKKGR